VGIGLDVEDMVGNEGYIDAIDRHRFFPAHERDIGMLQDLEFSPILNFCLFHLQKINYSPIIIQSKSLLTNHSLGRRWMVCFL
jgi:hypothetical protein